MEDIFFFLRVSRRGGKGQAITNRHHYRVRLFYTIMDMQL